MAIVKSFLNVSDNYLTTVAWLMDRGGIAVDKPMKAFWGMMGCVTLVVALIGFVISTVFLVCAGDLNALGMIIPCGALVAASVWFGNRLESNGRIV